MESTIGVAWILMPNLPPNIFSKKEIFSIASAAVEKPLILTYPVETKQYLVVQG